MKKLLLVLFILINVTSVFAADTKAAAKAETAVKLTGDMYVGGNMAQNADLAKDGKATFSYFDYDLNLNAAIKANDNATVNIRLTYDKNVTASGSVAKVESSNQNATSSLLAVERAYINYKFGPMFKVDAGLMGGGQWGTLFGNTEVNIMRVKGTFTIAEGMDIFAIYQKNTEQYDTIKWASTSEKNDSNTYYLAANLNFAPVKIIPLFAYGTTGKKYGDGTADNETSKTSMTADIAATGDFGMVGFEAEGVYVKATTKSKVPLAEDIKETTMGGYLNVFAKIDPAKIGFAVAYASDKSSTGKGVYSWGKDFDMTVVMDDILEVTCTNTVTAAAAVAHGDGTLGSAAVEAVQGIGYTVAKVYGEASVNDFTAGLVVAYGMDNNKSVEAGDNLGKGTFTEIDVILDYTIDEQTSYNVSAGYAMTSKLGGSTEKANVFGMYHGMKIKF